MSRLPLISQRLNLKAMSSSQESADTLSTRFATLVLKPQKGVGITKSGT